MDGRVNTLAEGEVSIKQGQTRPRAQSDATTCSRVIVRTWAQTFSLSDQSIDLSKDAHYYGRSILFVGHQDGHVFKTWFPHTYAGTRGLYYCAMQPSSICWRLGVSVPRKNSHIRHLHEETLPFEDEDPKIQHFAYPEI